MKINWDTIIAVIGTFVAQYSSAYWLWRKTRATVNPIQKPLNRWTGIIGRAKYLIRTYWFVAVALALPLAGILRELFRPGPVSKLSLFFIVLFTIALSAEISLLAAFALFVRLSRHISELSEHTTELSGRTVTLAKALGEQGRHTIETFEQVVGILKEPKPDALDRLRGAVKRLLPWG